MKNIIFIAPPAAGKGTQAQLVSEEYNIPHISTGEILRSEINAGSEIGLSIKKDMDSGILVSDEVITTLLKNRITSSDCKNGYILDGYPRSLKQAKLYNDLLEGLKYDKGIVIFLNIDRELALERTLSRVVCSDCGTSYNLLVEDLKPKKEDMCDKCHSQLKTRTDDNEEVFKKRFDTYMNSTKEVIEYYQSMGLLRKIEASNKDVKTIFEEVKEILND